MEPWLQAASLTAAGRPALIPGEIERAQAHKVDLEAEDNPNFPPLRAGLLTLTTHRLVWIDGSSIRGYYLPLSAVLEAFPSKKSLKRMFFSPRISIVVKAGTIVVVLREKSEGDSFYGRLMEVLRERSWDGVKGRGVESGSSSERRTFVGVSGIIRREQEKWESTDKSLQEAFQDLNALMRKAKEMVELAGRMRTKLLTGSNFLAGPANDDEFGSKQEIQDWFLSIGIVSPVTKETAGALYHQELSRQLADFVQHPLKKAGGMIALIDVYCLFNRARGTELISPEDLLQACALWEKINVPVMLRKFDSDVMVIQDKFHSDKEVFERIKSLALTPNALRLGLSPSDAAMTLGVAPALAKEYLLAAEKEGLLCRDVSPEGFRFYINLFGDINPSGMYMMEGQGLMRVWALAVSS